MNTQIFLPFHIKKLLIILFVLYTGGVCAQKYADKEHYLVDSLNLNEIGKKDLELINNSLTVYHTSKNDTDKLNALNLIVEESWDGNVWPKYNLWIYNYILNNGTKNKDTTSVKAIKLILASTINNMGLYQKQHGQIASALEKYKECLTIQQELDHKRGIAVTLNNIALIYHTQGDIENTLKYFHESLKIREELNDQKGVSNSINNLGLIYDDQGDYKKALEYYNWSYAIADSLKHLKGMAMALNNIGFLYKKRGDPFCERSQDVCYNQSIKKALNYYLKSLKIRQDMGNKKGEAESLNNIGAIFKIIGDTNCVSTLIECTEIRYKLTLQYYFESLKIRREIGDKNGIANSLSNISRIQLSQGKIKSSVASALESLAIGRELKSPIRIGSAAKILAEIYKAAAVQEDDPKKKNYHYKEGLKMFELHIQMRDSINNEKTQKATIRQQTKYEFEKAQLVAEQLRSEELRVKNEELKRRDNLQYSVILVAILAVFGMVLALGKISVSPKVAEGLIFFAFLILFEFLLVLSDPYVDGFTNGEPMYKLLLNALLAGLIFPLHSFFERSLKHRLIKNRKK